MNHASALLALLQKLPLLGLSDDQIEVDQATDDPDIKVSLNFSEGNRIVVTVSDFWRFPGISCYFVNFHHVGGNLMACAGTPHVERAIFDIGCCTGCFVHPVR